MHILGTEKSWTKRTRFTGLRYLDDVRYSVHGLREQRVLWVDVGMAELSDVSSELGNHRHYCERHKALDRTTFEAKTYHSRHRTREISCGAVRGA